MVLNVTNKCNLACTYCYEYGDDKIVDKWLSTRPSEDWGYDLWLLPGTYRVTLRGKLRAEATLTIGTTEPPPLTMQLGND